MERTNIDKLFKAGLNEHEIQPGESAFDRIEAKRKGFNWKQIISVVLLVGLGISAYFVASGLQVKKTEEKPKLAPQQYAMTSAPIKRDEVMADAAVIAAEPEAPAANDVKSSEPVIIKNRPKTQRSNTKVASLDAGTSQLEPIRIVVEEVKPREELPRDITPSEIASPIIKVRLNKPTKVNLEAEDIVSPVTPKIETPKTKKILKLLEKGVEERYTAFISRNYESSGESRKFK